MHSIRILAEINYEDLITLLRSAGAVHPSIHNFAVKLEKDGPFTAYTVMTYTPLDNAALNRLRSSRGVINVREG